MSPVAEHEPCPICGGDCAGANPPVANCPLAYPAPSAMSDGPALNTDREIWRERPGDFYADSIHVTEQGSIGINCGGMVYVMPVRRWHALAAAPATNDDTVKDDMYQCCARRVNEGHSPNCAAAALASPPPVAGGEAQPVAITEAMVEALMHAREKMWVYGFSEDELKPIRDALSLAALSSVPGKGESKIWIVKIWNADATDCDEYVFNDKADYERFLKDKPPELSISDIHERFIIDVPTALKYAAELSASPKPSDPSSPEGCGTMSDITDIERQLRAGLDKASAGKWQVGHNWVFIDPIDPERNPSHALRNIMRDVPEDELQANVDHIVAAQPDNIRLLLDELSRRSEVIERAKEALTDALVAMKLAAALPGVSNEYDFEPAIATVSAARALLQGESNG